MELGKPVGLCPVMDTRVRRQRTSQEAREGKTQGTSWLLTGLAIPIEDVELYLQGFLLANLVIALTIVFVAAVIVIIAIMAAHTFRGPTLHQALC